MTMEIEQVAELARAVAALPQAERDFFEGMVADVRAEDAEAKRIAKLRAMSDEEVVRKALVECTEYAQHHDEHDALKILREAGFERGDLKLLGEAHQALEGVLRLVVDATPQLSSAKLANLNTLIMQAAVALSLANASPPERDRVDEGLTTRETLIMEWGSNWRVGLARINFERAYTTACLSSQPDAWMEAALLGKQLVNALDGRP